MINLDRSIAIETCKNLKNFYAKLSSLYESEGMSITEDLGRRNILMSGPMERFLANALSARYPKVVNDGKTGQPDIVVFTENGDSLELECKLTSPHQSSGSIAFQTDYETLVRKGKVDYVYLVANEAFDEFCFIYFEGLTKDDFRSLSPGARGKVQMYKHRGMKKATVLMGQMINREEVQAQKLSQLLSNLLSEEQTEKIIEKVYNVKEKIMVVKDRNASYTLKFEEA